MTDSSRQCSVLVVEDEPLILFDAVDMIEDAGFEVHAVTNAKAALDVMERCQDVGILFTDLEMPGAMDGSGLAHAIKARWPAVAVIIVSGHPQPDLKAMPLDCRFFAKPYLRNSVLSALNDADIMRA